MTSEYKETLSYYDTNCRQFLEETVNVGFSSVQESFLQLIPENGLILDFGCGSGRDSLYFLQKGYRVEACDGSAEMVKAASEHTGLPVKQMLFSELNEKNYYDGIFACASILHVPYAELPDIISKINDALKVNGIVYISFKYGDFEGCRNGRYFTDMNEARLEHILAGISDLKIVKTGITGDVRPGRGHERWLNVLLRKTA